MADVFTNDLRIREQESGSNAGTWGGLLNTTIRNIASAFGQGSETIPNASTHTITLADGVADEARSLYLKCTGGGQACTVTLAPNTVSKVWIISNETSYTLTFSQGSGANVAVAAGAVKVIVTDGAGSGAAVVDALSGLDASLSGLTVDTTTLVVDATNNRVGIGDSSPSNTLTITNGSSGATEANGAIVPLMIENSSSAYINFLTPNNANAGLLFSDPEGNNVGQMQYLHGSNALVFATGASEAMRILASGDIGYTGKLFSSTSTSALGGLQLYRNHANGECFLFDTTTAPFSGPLIFGTNNAEAMRILSNQRVSIGGSSSNHLLNLTSSTTPALEFTRGSGNATIGIDNGNSIAVGGTAGDLVLRASGTTGVTKFTDSGGNITMTLTEANNVGIGTSSPNNTLSILGSVNQLDIETSTTGVTIESIDRSDVAAQSDLSFYARNGEHKFFGSAYTERMRISASGYVNPKANVANTNAPDTQGLHFGWNYSNGAGESLIVFNRGAGTTGGLTFVDNSSSGTHDEIMRLEGGNLLVGTTSTGSYTDGKLSVFGDGSVPAATFKNAGNTGQFCANFWNAAGSGTRTLINFTTNASPSVVGSISTNGSTTAYNTSSDYRLKENIADADDAGSKVDAIQVRKFDWIADGAHQDYGMVAQELQTVAPEAVSAPEDPEEMMGVDYSKLVPMLVKEIQSLRARVQQLENN